MYYWSRSNETNVQRAVLSLDRKYEALPPDATSLQALSSCLLYFELHLVDELRKNEMGTRELFIRIWRKWFQNETFSVLLLLLNSYINILYTILFNNSSNNEHIVWTTYFILKLKSVVNFTFCNIVYCYLPVL